MQDTWFHATSAMRWVRGKAVGGRRVAGTHKVCPRLRRTRSGNKMALSSQDSEGAFGWRLGKDSSENGMWVRLERWDMATEGGEWFQMRNNRETKRADGLYFVNELWGIKYRHRQTALSVFLDPSCLCITSPGCSWMTPVTRPPYRSSESETQELGPRPPPPFPGWLPCAGKVKSVALFILLARLA